MKKEYIAAEKLDLFLGSNKPHIDDSIKKISKMIGLVRIEQEKALKVILFNLWFNKKTRVRTPMKHKVIGCVRYNPVGIGAKGLKSAVTQLKEHKLIDVKSGYYKLGEENDSETTTVLATEKLTKLLIDDNWVDAEIRWVSTPEVVRLRKDNKDKTLVDYVDGNFSNWLRGELTKYNELLAGTEIYILSKREESVAYEAYDLNLSRVFIDHNIVNPKGDSQFAYGGRMYASWCDLSSEMRQRLEINGNKTVEIDYEGGHVRAIYMELTGKPYISESGDTDPYGNLTIDGVDIPRFIVKKMATIMQFTDSIKDTVGAVNNAYNPRKIKFGVKSDTRPKKDKDKAAEYNSIVKQTPLKLIIRAYLQRHKVIKDYYLGGKRIGHFIQFIESNMVFEVVVELTKRGIPVLTIYDSFIVEHKYEDLVKDLMSSTPHRDRIYM
jgi:hypothetical protein